MSSTDNDARPVTWGAKRRGKVFKYSYTTVSEIYKDEMSHSSTCNIYGIITDFKEPTQSKGSDFFALVFVVDDTSHEPLRIRLFSRDLSFFPKVANGDIIRLHRLRVYKMNTTNLNSMKGWSWVLWRYEDRDNILASEKASSESYTLLSSDRDIVSRLRAWHEKNSSAISSNFNKNLRIIDIPHGAHFSLLCQVVDFKEVTDTHVIVKVWDGTLPTQSFYVFDSFDNQTEISKDVPNEYIVQVSIYDGHVAHWQQLNVEVGSFVKFRNLHAWANPQHVENRNKLTLSELSLHPGNAYDRGMEFACKNDQLDVVQRDITAALDFLAFTGISQSLNYPNSLEHHNGSASSINGAENTSKENKAISSHSDKNKLSQSHAFTQLSSQASQCSDSSDFSAEPRCLQESLTIVTGDGMPMKLTNLCDVMKCEVPLHTSKHFRVRIKVQSCITDESEFVGHYSPVTGMFFPTSNTGKPLETTPEVRDFVQTWRKVRGMDSSTTVPADIESQQFSQWDVPTGTQQMSAHICEKDGSKWESMETETYVVRKRRKEEKKFTILYLLKCDNMSPQVLKKWSSKHDRVIRSIPLSLLVTEHPAVGIQHNVFYYSCPGYAVEPRLPSLKEEAENFLENRISLSMGSPTLVPRFRFVFKVADKSGILDNVCLTGKHAVEFLCETTPQSYLENSDGVASSVKKCIDKIVAEDVFLECIIEKKSRRSTNETDKPIYLYEICNTTLAQ